MSEPLLYQWLADAVLTLHMAVVLFVVGGLALIVMGNRRGWRWVNGLAFRVTHGLAIATVVAESWLGITCPLTHWEMQLRALARSGGYSGSFVQHWLQRLLYFDAPDWVFTLAYTLFGVAVLAVWIRFPPRRQGP